MKSRYLNPWTITAMCVLFVACVIALTTSIDPATAATGLLLANAPAGLELKVLQDALKDHGAKVTEFIEKQAEAMNEIKQRVQDVEQKTAKKGSGSGDENAIGRVADLIIKSDGLAAFTKGHSNAVTITVPRALFKAAITNATGQNQPLVAADRRPGIVAAPQQRMTIRDLFASVPTSSNLIEFCKESVFTNNAGPQYDNTSPTPHSEGAPKNESDITFTLEQSAVVTIAHWIPASRQVLSDAPALAQHLDNRLLYGLKVEEEDELMNGDGTVGNLNGLLNQATQFTGGSTNLTALDALALGIGQLVVSNYEPSGFVINPADWYSSKLLLAKDSQGRYLFGDPGAMTAPRLWGLPVVPTTSIAAGTFMVLDAARAGYIADREDATVRISESHSDFFVKNMVAVLCEERLAFVCTQGGAMIKGSLSYAG
jgi:HK97 family phage major capsid protein